MLKPLLFILVLVILLALALNFNLFSTPISPHERISTSVKPKSKIIEPKKEPSPQTISPTIEEDPLAKELQALLNKAQALYRKAQYEDAILIYEKVIKLSKEAKKVKILKLFALACLNKANAHYSYPRYDIDGAIESFELIIKKFEKQQDKALLLNYMEAVLNRATLISKEELIESYGAIIEKFEADKEQRFEKEIEELLFAKSFALMGIDDEEAIAVLDRIISKYSDRNRTNLPDTVKYSILNNIELSIITSNDTDRYVELANKYMADLPDTKPLIEMLDIIKGSQDLEQDEAVEQWMQEHRNYAFPDWDFTELNKWVNKMEVPERKERVRKYLNIFQKKKYSEIYRVNETHTRVSENEKREPTEVPIKEDNSEEENSEEVNSIETNARENNGDNQEDSIEIEPDPYLNDILETQPEITYPNPYDPNIEAGGLSYEYVEPQVYRGD